MLLSILLLLGVGVVVIYSSSGPYALNKKLPENLYVISHIKKVVLGLFALFVGMNLKREWLKIIARPLFYFCLLLLLALLFSGIGITLNGAKRWISIGGFEFQPSELMKFSIILMMALKLEELKPILKHFKEGFMKPIVMVGVVFFLILMQPNYSMASMILIICLVMMYTAGCKLKHMGVLALAGLPVFAYLAVSQSYRLKRITALFNPDANSSGSSYQQLQSLISLGNGGLLGQGLGQGTQKLGYLPMPFTDMIYAMIGEELGFVGTFSILILFGILIWRGIQAASQSNDLFSSLVALGLTLAVAINCFLHIGVCIRVLPPSGQPLPLISYGGSSLVMTLFSLGILLRLSGQKYRGETHVEEGVSWK